MKKFLPLIGALIIGVVLGALIFRPSGPDAAYWIARAAYDRDVQDRQDRLDNALGLIAEKDIEINEGDVALAESAQIISDLQRKIGSGSQTIASQDREIDRLRTDAAAAIAANPAVGALVNAYEVQLANCKSQIFNLSKQVKELGVPVEAGVDPATGEKLWAYPQGTITNRLHGQFLAAVAQRDAWRAQYEEEHGLRLTCDSLRLNLEHQAGRGKFWKPAAITEALVIGALAIFGK